MNPSDEELAELARLNSWASEPFYDLFIVGGGPAGLGAALYGAPKACASRSWRRNRRAGMQA